MDESNLQIVIKAIDEASAILKQVSGSAQNLAQDVQQSMDEMMVATEGGDKGFISLGEAATTFAGIVSGQLPGIINELNGMLGPLAEDEQGINNLGTASQDAEEKVVGLSDIVKNFAAMQFGQQIANQFI